MLSQPLWSTYGPTRTGISNTFNIFVFCNQNVLGLSYKCVPYYTIKLFIIRDLVLLRAQYATVWFIGDITLELFTAVVHKGSVFTIDLCCCRFLRTLTA